MFYPIKKYVSYVKLSQNHRTFLAALDNDAELRNYLEAVQDSRWHESTAKEIRALEENKEWTVKVLPPSKRPIRCKWIFNVTT